MMYKLTWTNELHKYLTQYIHRCLVLSKVWLSPWFIIKLRDEGRVSGYRYPGKGSTNTFPRLLPKVAMFSAHLRVHEPGDVGHEQVVHVVTLE